MFFLTSIAKCHFFFVCFSFLQLAFLSSAQYAVAQQEERVELLFACTFASAMPNCFGFCAEGRDATALRNGPKY